METTTQPTIEYDVAMMNTYDKFIKKYMDLLWLEVIDYNNYAIRSFLALHVADKKISKKLRRGKLQQQEVTDAARKVLQYLRFKLRNHDKQELYNELLIPFIQCIRSYRDIGVGFERYAYKTYKFSLKKHLDNIKLDGIDTQFVLYIDGLTEEQWMEMEEEEKLVEEHFTHEPPLELDNPQWIHGTLSSAPFSEMKPHERYVLSKYYYEQYTDKEIARMIPYHPKAIHRIRMRMKKQLESKYENGELKWIRI